MINATYKNISQDLKDALPESDGFSPVNLFYIRRFYDLYFASITNFPQIAENFKDEICPQLVGDFIFLVPWGHHRTIIDTYFEDGNLDAAIFYLKKTVEDGWSRNVLKTFIDSGLHLNHLVKTEQDNPTIGLLICKDKDNVLAQYALESSSQPIGVAEFQLTKFIPDEFKSTLPTIEEIETELK